MISLVSFQIVAKFSFPNSNLRYLIKIIYVTPIRRWLSMTSTIDSPVQQTRVTVGHLKIFFTIKINFWHQGVVKIIEIVISLTFSRKISDRIKIQFRSYELNKITSKTGNSLFIKLFSHQELRLKIQT